MTFPPFSMLRTDYLDYLLVGEIPDESRSSDTLLNRGISARFRYETNRLRAY